MSQTRFDRDTALRPLAEGEFEATLDRGWWIVVGPNGGYLAAILVRALSETVGDPARPPHSLTVHYLSPAHQGPVRVRTRVERAGRSLTALSARLEQDGALVALALAAFAQARPSPGFADARMPEVAPPESLVPFASEAARVAPMRGQLDSRPAFGDPLRASSSEALTGGWIRLHEPRVADYALLALLCDAWPPAVARHPALAGAPRRGTPTIDLTIHFRAPVPADARRDDFYLCVFRSRTLHAGFVEEDGEIWTRGGRLLAQSRQLAMLV